MYGAITALVHRAYRGGDNPCRFTQLCSRRVGSAVSVLSRPPFSISGLVEQSHSHEFCEDACTLPLFYGCCLPHCQLTKIFHFRFSS